MIGMGMKIHRIAENTVLCHLDLVLVLTTSMTRNSDTQEATIPHPHNAMATTTSKPNHLLAAAVLQLMKTLLVPLHLNQGLAHPLHPPQPRCSHPVLLVKHLPFHQTTPAENHPSQDHHRHHLR